MSRSALSLVMPMAGRGSRFARNGVMLPKPLIELDGKPFFWWAAESVRRLAPVGEMVFVVLDEHVARFGIDRAVRRCYPEARIEIVAGVTAGAAETAAIGVRALASDGAVAICDSDHAFDADPIAPGDPAPDAALLCFRSGDPAYSYAAVDAGGTVTGTVEKRVVSAHAIAGCYLFARPATYLTAFDRYRSECPYPELFVSGVYNALIADGGRVELAALRRHVSFGTPEELARVVADQSVAALWRVPA